MLVAAFAFNLNIISIYKNGQNDRMIRGMKRVDGTNNQNVANLSVILVYQTETNRAVLDAKIILSGVCRAKPFGEVRQKTRIYT